MTPVGSLRAAAVASAVVLLTAAPGAQTPPQAVVIDAPGRSGWKRACCPMPTVCSG
jgi:hypothetical protein